MDFLNLSGKTFYIAGVANKKSVAYFTARTLLLHGGKCIFSVQSESQLEGVKKLFPESKVFVYDVKRDQDLCLKINEKLEEISEEQFLVDILPYIFKD
jgi:enoyl-[acyl-carrier protein] reductase I